MTERVHRSIHVHSLTFTPFICTINYLYTLWLYRSYRHLSIAHEHHSADTMNPNRRGSESEGSNPTSSASPTPTLRDNRPLPPIIDASPSLPDQSSDRTPQASGIGKGHPAVSASSPETRSETCTVTERAATAYYDFSIYFSHSQWLSTTCSIRSDT